MTPTVGTAPASLAPEPAPAGWAGPEPYRSAIAELWRDLDRYAGFWSIARAAEPAATQRRPARRATAAPIGAARKGNR